MAGKTPANLSRKNSGFSLIELVIVMVMMVVVMGVAASLLYGMMTMYQTTNSQTAARRRAQDVFNILKVALQNAGIGVPGGDFKYYFGAEGSASNPTKSFLADWNSPVEPSRLNEGGTHEYGDVLRIVYSLPTGLKFEAAAEVREFSDDGNSQGVTPPAQDLKFVGSSFDHVIDGNNPGGILLNTDGNTRSFVTFPGMGMHPLFAEGKGAGNRTLALRGITPKARESGKPSLPLYRNVINPYADLYALRVSVAFVGGDSTFYMLDVFDEDPLADNNKPPDAGDLEALAGFRVEGIKAVRFFPSGDRHQITVWVLAEGGVNELKGNDDTPARDAVENRKFKYNDKLLSIWEDVDFNSDIYYEDFFMTWRMRNLQQID